ncbi:MAG: methylated-DNA--[protein]-cysteine S-methyltransferase [Alphaproteobacteria bacterium]|nr:methylated-DNA--[protein]-cysteine S-methyltransferase [Alphaproteobacteria bacterium]
MRARRHIGSPLGLLTVAAEDGHIVGLGFGAVAAEERRDDPLLVEAGRQLDAYFARRLRAFDLPLLPQGSAFHRAVWDAMLRIPYGEARSYGALAAETGGVARAVGIACGSNPIAIVIPCHRVIGAGGRMVGYSGGKGVKTKSWLLVHEGWRPPREDPAQLALFGGSA